MKTLSFVFASAVTACVLAEAEPAKSEGKPTAAPAALAVIPDFVVQTHMD